MLARFEASPQNAGCPGVAEDPGETLPASESQIEAMMMESHEGVSQAVSPVGSKDTGSVSNVGPGDSVSNVGQSDGQSDDEPYHKLVFFFEMKQQCME